MTCGGGGTSVVRGGVATFRYVMFENNRAPRGGGVCVHDATAVYGGRNDGDDGALGDAPPPVAFRGNAAAHPWIGQTSPAIDVECVQCFERVNGTTGKYAVVVDPSRCASSMALVVAGMNCSTCSSAFEGFSLRTGTHAHMHPGYQTTWAQ